MSAYKEQFDILIDLLLDQTKKRGLIWFWEGKITYRAKFQSGWVEIKENGKDQFSLSVLRDENDTQGTGLFSKDPRIESLYKSVEGSYQGRFAVLKGIVSELQEL